LGHRVLASNGMS